MARQEYTNELERKLTLTDVNQQRELLKNYTKWLNDKIRDEDDLNELIDNYLEAINYTYCCKSDSELLPKRLSNRAYNNAKTMRYEDFVKWWDEQV